MTKKEFEKIHRGLCRQALSLSRRKSKDYSPGADCLRNYRAAEMLGIDSRLGVVLRVQDKLARLATHASGAVLENESVHDSVIDILNYIVIYAALERGVEVEG